MITVGDIRKVIEGLPEDMAIRLVVQTNAEEGHFVELDAFGRHDDGRPFLMLSLACPFEYGDDGEIPDMEDDDFDDEDWDDEDETGEDHRHDPGETRSTER